MRAVYAVPCSIQGHLTPELTRIYSTNGVEPLGLSPCGTDLSDLSWLKHVTTYPDYPDYGHKYANNVVNGIMWCAVLT